MMLTTTKLAFITGALWLGAGLHFALTATPSKTEVFTGKVTRVVDGDTLDVQRSPDNLSRIRLACIDAPEKAQKPYGEAAKTKLTELALGKQVTVRSSGPDQYGRLIGKVEIEGRSLNVALVESGNAAVYKQYLGPCPELKPALLEAEAQAKAKKLGFWQAEPLILPWDWRRSPGK